MQLDRRLMVGAGLGLGLGMAATAASAKDKSSLTAAKSTDLGVVPDSGQDETARLQAAIDKAVERRVALSLPAGRYIAGGLRLRPGAHVQGVAGLTVLQHLGGRAMFAGEGIANVRLDGLTLRGAFAMSQGVRGLIEFKRVARLDMRDLDVDMSKANGVMLERCGGIVTGCRINDAANAGLFSLDAEGGLEISHNHIVGCANNGILVWRSAKGDDGTIVAMNRVERIAARNGGTGQNGNGINVFRAGGVIVTSNKISDCAFSAVRANSAADVQIIANNVARLGEVALYSEFAFEGAVISGNLVDGASTGISVTNFNEGGRLATVQGNLIRNLVKRAGEANTSGFGIAVEADAAVTGNTIEGAPGAGLLIGWGRFCRDVAASGNVIRGCDIGIAVTGDAAAGVVLIANNMISGARRGAIRAMDHGRMLGDDLAVQPPGTSRIRLSGNAVA